VLNHYTPDYNYLSCLRKKCFRNGNWRRLNIIEKALFVASLSLAKIMETCPYSSPLAAGNILLMHP
jgi:hypothetical protein